MTTEQLQTEQSPAFDEKAIRERLIDFRIKYVEKSQRKAAVLLNEHAPTLSRYEAGKIPITFALIATLATLYKLNVDWLITGKGKPVIGEEPKGNLLTDMSVLNARMATLGKYIKVMELRQNKLFNIIEKLEGEIEILKKK